MECKEKRRKEPTLQLISRSRRSPSGLRLSVSFRVWFFFMILATGLVTFSERQFEIAIQHEQMSNAHYMVLDGTRSFMNAVLLSIVAYFAYYNPIWKRFSSRTIIYYMILFFIYLGFVSYLSFLLYSVGFQIFSLKAWSQPYRFELILTETPSQFFLFTVTVATMHGVYFFHHSTAEEVRLIKIEQSLAQERLQSLQTKLNPHFLFNTLNIISAMMYRDTEVADRMIERLSELLRASLNLNSIEVTIGEELKLLDAYSSIMRERFPDQFEISVSCDPQFKEFFIPPFLLQPLVENFFKHSYFELRDATVEPGKVDVVIRNVESKLIISVTDNGLSLEEVRQRDEFKRIAGQTTVHRADSFHQGGLGLKVTRDRLRLLYGRHATLSFGRRITESGYRVEITIPLEIVQIGVSVTLGKQLSPSFTPT